MSSTMDPSEMAAQQVVVGTKNWKKTVMTVYRKYFSVKIQRQGQDG